MMRFATDVNGFYPLTIVAKALHPKSLMESWLRVC